MTAIPDDELLSAYLDGELTADESARVERLLVERPESRQLLEELRLVRESLQALPRGRLGDDFSQHVLRQAERELLRGPKLGETPTPGDLSGSPIGASHRHMGGPTPERGTAHGADDPGKPPQGPDLTLASSADSPPHGFDWQRLRRPVAWASVALAAGLLIMFLSPNQNGRVERQVAKQPAPRGEPAGPGGQSRGSRSRGSRSGGSRSGGSR
jgi:anti-sigma factor RsiW